MVDIAASRAAVADALQMILDSNVHVYPAPPERPAFPAVILTEADAEFITPAETYGQFEIQWKALVVAAPSTSNTVMTAAADLLVSTLLTNLGSLRPQVDTYAVATLAGQNYLTAQLTLTHTT